MFEIVCKELTKERKRIIAVHQVATLNKALRGVMAVGGVWIFYYGTSFDVPDGVESVAIAFAIVGITATLLAIFSQKLIEISFFSKAIKIGCFPKEVSVGEGGVFIRRRPAKNDSDTPGVTSVNAERFFTFFDIKNVDDFGDYFKMRLPEGHPGVFLFKEDFEKGDPEAFIDTMADRYFRSK